MADGVNSRATVDDDRLARGRARIDRTTSGLRVTIPAKREWPLLLFLLCWFGGWTVAGITVVSSLASGNAEDGAAFTVFWLGGWVLGWLFALSVLTWSLMGREIVEIDNAGLTVRRVAGPYKRDKQFARGRISDIQVEPYEGLARELFKGRNSWRHGMEMWGLGGGSIALDYGAQTHRFANKLDRPEATQIIEHIRRELRLPERDPSLPQ
jgi:hypothetical protein